MYEKRPSRFKWPSNQWLAAADRWILFDPDRWPHREAISRATALVIIAAFVMLRIHRFDQFPQFLNDAVSFYSGFTSPDGTSVYSRGDIYLLWGIKLTVWSIESAIYMGYMAAYLSRAKAKSVARGILEVALPLAVASLPVLLSLMPYSLPRWLPIGSRYHLAFFLMVMGCIAAGGLVNLVGLLTMRQAFTIMSEARTLVTNGIFSHVRHPLYTGHFIMFFGSMLLRLHWVSVLIYVVFAMGQVLRARIEERKLESAFGQQYRHYKRHTGMFLPRRMEKLPGRILI